MVWWFVRGVCPKGELGEGRASGTRRSRGPGARARPPGDLFFMNIFRADQLMSAGFGPQGKGGEDLHRD